MRNLSKNRLGTHLGTKLDAKFAQVGSKIAHVGTKMSQDGPKMGQEGPRMTQDGSKMALKGALSSSKFRKNHRAGPMGRLPLTCGVDPHGLPGLRFAVIPCACNASRF